MTGIPFNRPAWMGNEMAYLREAMDSGNISGDGQFTRRVESQISQMIGGVWTRLTNSCTSALEIAALLCDLQPDDEVIMPAFTFVSTANAACLRGARPVFVDIRPDTLNLDERLVEAAVTPRTRAIIPIHYAGVVCEMAPLIDIARRHGLMLIEDAAQAFLCRYRGRWAGTIGDIGCFSFHETKTFHAGEGGAIVLRRPDLIERTEILREKGTNRSRFLAGQVDKYTWVDVGSSYLPSDLIAAVLLGQIEAAETILSIRRRLFERYFAAFEPLEAKGWIRRPVVPAYCDINFHFFYLLVESAEQRTAMLQALYAQKIHATFHYVPLHKSPVAERLGLERELPVTESAAGRIIRLPLYNSLSEAEQKGVISAVFAFFNEAAPT